MPVILENLAWPEIAGLRDKNGGLLLLPLGATEQHGPHLPVAMDTLLAEAVCHAASALTQVPVLPALRYTVSQGHTPKWPGTFSLRHETFIASLREIAAWAVASGWKKILFINAHFGNDAPARVAVDQLRLAHLGKLQVGLIHVFKLTDSIWAEYTEDADDLHANQAETSLMLHLHPERVKMALAKRDGPKHSDTYRKVDMQHGRPIYFVNEFEEVTENGTIGHPDLATAEKGKMFFDGIVAEVAVFVDEFTKWKLPNQPDDI
jgi:creatinine amidohydrolase